MRLMESAVSLRESGTQAFIGRRPVFAVAASCFRSCGDLFLRLRQTVGWLRDCVRMSGVWADSEYELYQKTERRRLWI